MDIELDIVAEMVVDYIEDNMGQVEHLVLLDIVLRHTNEKIRCIFRNHFS